MRMDIHCSFKFNNVGFGLFTTGNIGNFKFVYDCGSRSVSTVKECIKNEFSSDDKLDLLAISHLHKDHISGLKELLNTVNSVETIVLPYFSPLERLVYILSLYNNPKEDEPEDLLDFIIDPVNYLLENFDDKISNIILFNGGERLPDSESNPQGNKPSDPKKNKSSNKRFEIYKLNISDLKNADDESEIKANENISSSKVHIKEYGMLKLVSSDNVPIWQFVFYSPILSKKQKKYFRGIMNSALRVKDDPCTKIALLKILEKGDFKKNAIKSKVSNSDINNTSLLLYHSPIKDKNNSTFWSDLNTSYTEILCENVTYFRDRMCAHFGFFYTGDINLNNKIEEIKIYYGKLLTHIGLLQVPHHGSIENWNDMLSKSNPRMIHVISSKYSNNKKLHPNLEVLYSITANSGIILWCNEKQSINITGHLWNIF